MQARTGRNEGRTRTAPELPCLTRPWSSSPVRARKEWNQGDATLLCASSERVPRLSNSFPPTHLQNAFWVLFSNIFFSLFFRVFFLPRQGWDKRHRLAVCRSNIRDREGVTRAQCTALMDDQDLKEEHRHFKSQKRYLKSALGSG